MTGRLAGAALILAGALWLFLSSRADERCRQRLRQELYRSLETIAGGIRWKKQRLPDLLAAAQSYPLAGVYYGALLQYMAGNMPLQASWERAFSTISVEKDALLTVELSGDEQSVTASLQYAAGVIRQHWEGVEGERQRTVRLRLAGIFSAAGFLIILLL